MRNGKDTRGFTLIELLVVVAIIGILAAIAIPQFSAYRANSFDAHAVTALNWLAKSEEAYFATQGRYTQNLGDLQSYYPPNGVTVTVTTASSTTFEAEASHDQGTRTYNWDSSTGGLQEP
jgi:type IV pilus assembly protein PilA